jgi:hypothetical protein
MVLIIYINLINHDINNLNKINLNWYMIILKNLLLIIQEYNILGYTFNLLKNSKWNHLLKSNKWNYVCKKFEASLIFRLMNNELFSFGSFNG